MAWAILGAAGLALLFWFIWAQNNLLVVKRYEVASQRIAEPLRIVQLSDLHGKRFGRGNRRLLKRVRALRPGLIAITGDIIDRFRPGLSQVYALVEQLLLLAPVVYCSGNHEYGRQDREEIFRELSRRGVRVLRHQIAELKFGQNHVAVLGIDEIGYGYQSPRWLESLERHPEFRLLLAHFPHYFEPSYSKYGIDLTLSGHAHGGQFWFPGGGVYAPGQGLFPKYCKGMHKKGNAIMIVSRGLGNSGFPLRLLNFPQIVAVELLPEEQ